MLKPVPLLPRVLAGFLISVLVCGVFGCAKKEPSEPATGDKSTSQSQAQLDQVAEIPSAQQLPGVWLGEAVLDEVKLHHKVRQLPYESREVALAKARSFLSTVMAIEYRSDGTLENDLAIVSIDGQILRDDSFGSWRVVESKDDGLVVETQEQLSDGTVATDQVFYKFFDGGNRFAMAVPVNEDLQGCDAMMVFERQAQPVTNVADGGTTTQTK